MGNENESHESYYEAFNRAFCQTLERGVNALPAEMQAELYKPCAIGCVQNYVLKEQKRQFDECGGDLDLQYERYGKSEYFFAEIIERGHVYEIGYPRCLCPMVQAGFSTLESHCECSKQSVLYVLQTLLPEKSIRIETLHTVLSGASECRFRVTVD